MYAFFEFKIKVRLRRSAWHGYQWCVRNYVKLTVFVDCKLTQRFIFFKLLNFHFNKLVLMDKQVTCKSALFFYHLCI